MTEQEWLNFLDPTRQLAYLHDSNASQRRLRLYVCAVCRSITFQTEDVRILEAIQIGEEMADDSLYWEAERDLSRQVEDVRREYILAALDEAFQTAEDQQNYSVRNV